MRKTLTFFILVLLAALCCTNEIAAQQPQRAAPGQGIDASGIGLCGTSSDWVWKINQLARREAPQARQAKAGPPVNPAPAAVFTPQSSFPAAQVVSCGKFRLYYEDFLQPNHDGFANSSLGALRRNTLCQVLTYVQSVYDFHHLAANDFIDLYVLWSYAPTNAASPGTGFLAQAGPLFGPGYGTTPGFYGGYLFDHMTTGVDPQPGQYDGVLQVNFDTAYTSSGPLSIAYWDDYTNTTSTCRWDLYSILLHEATHILGWLSNVTEDSSANHSAQNTLANSFTLFDKYFLYYGEAKTPSTFTGNKLVTVSLTPAVNPNVNSNPNPLRSSKVWMNNFGIPLNHPAYSGDFNGYFSLPSTPYAVQSLLSHLNDNVYSFTRMSQFSPGFQPNYVMGPGIAQEQLKRQWTNFEMRALLTMGYSLDPAFAASGSLTGGVATNQALLTANKPPQRTVPAQVTELAVWSTVTEAWAETLPVTATIATNNNIASNPAASSVVINVSSLGTDANGDTVKVMPGSLFNIRGTGSTATGSGNNHNQLSLNAAGTQVTFTPRPGFRGRAQFGFYLWDGKEQGSFCVATIDVSSVGSPYITSLPPAYNMVMNGTLENGTEVRQRLVNEGIAHTGREFYREGPFMSGDHLSDNQPSYNVESNNWSLAGGEYVYQSWKECSQVNGGVKGNYGWHGSDFNSSGYGLPVAPLGNSATNPNHRYRNFAGSWSFFELLTPVAHCHEYSFEMDVNVERTGLAVGNNFTGTLDFVTNPGTNPTTATTLQTASLSTPVTTVAHNAWQHFGVTVPYCSATAASFINLRTGVGNYPYNVPLIDNLSLSEVSVTPLIVSATASPPSVTTLGGCSTLSATTMNTLCGATYTWQPGSLSGQSVSVCPSATTTYTVTVNDGCRTAAKAVTVTVPPVGGSICGMKWNDSNHDGIHQTSEPGLQGWTIKLSNGQIALTDQFGKYCFTNLPAGSYTVAEQNQAGWTQTLPTNPPSYSVALSAGAVVDGKDFGNCKGKGCNLHEVPLCTLTGKVVSSCCLGPTRKSGSNFYSFLASVNLAGLQSTCTLNVSTSTTGLVIGPYGPTSLNTGANFVTGTFSAPATSSPYSLSLVCTGGVFPLCSTTLTAPLPECKQPQPDQDLPDPASK
ncbi:MAG TPA: SdrD B-like domain-containing protein [Thermoanaerobaculia bacterium]|nr:SdrD B-like domain-containing protein [Thermoanaerobaculia bacterium]